MESLVTEKKYKAFGIEYKHLKPPNGGDLYLTDFGVPVLRCLLPENWYDHEYFFHHGTRLPGTSAVYKVATKPVFGHSLDLVVKFCRIGEGVMVAGHASITRDVPHFVMVAERDDVIGFNLVGLKRRGLGREVIAQLKQAYHDVYFTSGNIRTIAASVLASGKFTTAETRRFLEFFADGKRSFARARRATAEETDAG